MMMKRVTMMTILVASTISCWWWWWWWSWWLQCHVHCISWGFPSCHLFRTATLFWFYNLMGSVQMVLEKYALLEFRKTLLKDIKVLRNEIRSVSEEILQTLYICPNWQLSFSRSNFNSYYILLTVQSNNVYFFNNKKIVFEMKDVCREIQQSITPRPWIDLFSLSKSNGTLT